MGEGIRMLIDKVKKYYAKEYDLNCAEVMMYASNEEYNLNLKSDTFKTMASFGGGMAIESVCGAITGSLAVIGILFTKERAHESERVKILCKEFFQRFEAELGTDNCAKLKAKYRNDEIRCSVIIDTAAEILDGIVKREIAI
jgi:C_GCAxxG_C_C family probable redox protein